MMDNFKKEAYKLQMTPEEKAAMKARLFGLPACAGLPAQAGAAAPASLAPARSSYTIFDFNFARVAVAGVLVVLLAGGGTVYAAEGALPGSPLYAVKVNINEPVRVALATTPAAKAAVEEQIAQTRVAEAQTLEAQGRLDATTSDELAQNFDEHAAIALALAASTSPKAAFAVATDVGTGAEGKSEPRAAAPSIRFAARGGEGSSTASTSEAAAQAEATTSLHEDDQNDIPATIERQRAILEQIKARVEGRMHARGNHDGDTATTSVDAITSVNVWHGSDGQQGGDSTQASQGTQGGDGSATSSSEQPQSGEQEGGGHRLPIDLKIFDR